MSFKHIYFNEDICNGCNVCADICPCDALAPNPEQGKPPIEMYPEECWFDGCCVTLCPREGAIEIVTPFQMRGAFSKE
jgi:NAD-dependent dihydropyrimidine dehydrogenase PreA subunit